MATLLQRLQEFNRKERFYLLGMALGNPAFQLSEDFRRKLGRPLGIQIPNNAFAAMDYHLDWLAASLYLTANPGAPGPWERDRRLITGTPEDIDLLVSYESDGLCHGVMVEAKGVTGYTNKQFQSKAKRLQAMSEKSMWESASAKPYFVVASPRPPQRLNVESCPDWIAPPNEQPRWIHMALPEGLKRVVRCGQNGRPSASRDHWTIMPESRGKGP